MEGGCRELIYIVSRTFKWNCICTLLNTKTCLWCRMRHTDDYLTDFQLSQFWLYWCTYANYHIADFKFFTSCWLIFFIRKKLINFYHETTQPYLQILITFVILFLLFSLALDLFILLFVNTRYSLWLLTALKYQWILKHHFMLNMLSS